MWREYGSFLGGIADYVNSYVGQPAAIELEPLVMPDAAPAPQPSMIFTGDEVEVVDEVVQDVVEEGEGIMQSVSVELTEIENPIQGAFSQAAQALRRIEAFENGAGAPGMIDEFMEEDEVLADFIAEDLELFNSAEIQENLIRRELDLANAGFEELEAPEAGPLVGAEEGFDATGELAEGGEELDEFAQGLLDIEDLGIEGVDVFGAAGVVLDGAQLAESAVTWSSIGAGVLESAATAGIGIGISEFGKYLINVADVNHEVYLKEHKIDEHGYIKDQADQDWPGKGTAGFLVFGDKFQMPCSIENFFGDDHDYWFVSYLDIKSYYRRRIQVHKSRIIVYPGNKKVADLTANDKKNVWVPLTRKGDQMIKLDRYPLYEVGTRVKMKNKEGAEGVIEQTYNHNKTDTKFEKRLKLKTQNPDQN